MERIGGRFVALALGFAFVGAACAQPVLPTATETPVPTQTPHLLRPGEPLPSWLFATDAPGPTPPISMTWKGIALRCGIADLADCASAVDAARDDLATGYDVPADHRVPVTAVVTSSRHCLPIASAFCTKVILSYGSEGDSITLVMPDPHGPAAVSVSSR